MGFRFFRRLRLAPGVYVNLSKSGPSVSFGPRGAKITVGGVRGPRATVGLPGTGIYYTMTLGKRSSPPAARVPPESRLSIGFFARLLTPADEEAFVDGLREVVAGDHARAYQHLQQASHLADGAFLAGITAMKLGRLEEAAVHLKIAAVDSSDLGKCFRKYGVFPAISIPITPHISAQLAPDLRSVLLALAEVHQHLGNAPEALASLRRLVEIDPEDLLMRLSLCELMLDASPPVRSTFQEIVGLPDDLSNDSPVHTTLLYYRAVALRRLGLEDSALRLLGSLLRRKKDRPPELLQAIEEERRRDAAR